MHNRTAVLNKTNVFIVLSLLLFFSLFLFGWHQVPGLYIWGLYTDIDGQMAAWYNTALSTWSMPLTLSNLNPFEGMGSLFFPNNIWLNPGALVLSLPLSKLSTYMLSYGVYMLEVSLSIYALARVTLRLSVMEALIAVESFLFFLFPPFSNFSHALSFFSGAPFNAHLMALLNFCLVLFSQLGKQTRLSNPVKTGLIIILFGTAIYSGPMTLITFIPMYGLFALGVFIQDLRDTDKRVALVLWKLTPLVLILLIGLTLDSFSYFSATIGYVSRSEELMQQSLSLMASLKILLQTAMNYHPSNYPQASLFFFQWTYPIAIFHLIAVAGGLIGCFVRRYRWIAISFLCAGFLTDACLILRDSLVLPKFSAMNPYFYLWSAYSFYGLFFAAFIGQSWAGIRHLFKSKKPPQRYPFFYHGTWLILIFPLIALSVLGYFGLSTKAPLPQSVRTPIIEHLENHIKLQPDKPFKGYAISYLGAQEGQIRPYLEGLTPDQMDNSVYVKSRDYLKQSYQNWHMFSDLWAYGIPTLEEYGQWITKPLYLVTGKIFANPHVIFSVSTINIYNLDYALLQTFGVRFIISDSQLSDARIKQAKTMTKAGTAPVYLYEILNPNLGNYSPTQTVTLNSAQEIIAYFKRHVFDFERTAIVQDVELPKNLSKAYGVSFNFGINKIHVTAQSHDTSLVLLPVQFSHCYKIHSNQADTTIKVFRANILQTAILFKHNLNAELAFDFGMMRNAQCRKQDIDDITALELDKVNLKA